MNTTETQNVSATISQTSLVPPSKDTAGETENDKQEYEPDMEKVCRSHPKFQVSNKWKKLIGTGQAREPEQAQAPVLPKDNGNYKKRKYDQSLFKALFKTFFFQIWTAGILKLMAGKFKD